MNCLECLDLLQRRLDGDNLPGSPTLDQHLAVCQSCRRSHAAGSLMLDGLKVLPRAIELPADFAQRMLGDILQDRLKRRAKMGRRVWVTVGLAAAILVTVWAGNTWLPQPRQPRAPEVVVKNKPEEPTPAPKEEKMTPLAQSVDEARSDVLDLAARLARDQALLFAAIAPKEMPTFPREPKLSVDEPLDPAAQSLRQAGQGVSEGLDTVSRNARRAVSFFMKELPVLDPTN